MKYKKKSTKFIALSLISALVMSVLPGVFSVKYAKADPNTTLYFSPSSTSVTAGSDFTMTALVDTGTNALTEVDVIITYDESLFSLTSIACSDTFPTEVANVIPSPQDGTASVACGKLSGDPVTSSAATVATFSFSALTTTVTDSAIGFDESSLAADDVEEGNMITTRTGATVTITAASTSNNDDNDSHNEKKKKTPKRYISQSKKSIKRGATLTQRGKKFSKKSPVWLYFSKPGGGYYAPMKIVSSSKGTFLLKYVVTKPKGTYSWYAVDMKTGKKSKTKTYKVKL